MAQAEQKVQRLCYYVLRIQFTQFASRCKYVKVRIFPANHHDFRPIGRNPNILQTVTQPLPAFTTRISTIAAQRC